MKTVLFSLALLCTVSANASKKVNKTQIGDAYEKFRVDISNLTQYSELEQRVIRATVKIVIQLGTNIHHGTGFIYKKNDKDELLFMTNNHVMKTQRECKNATIVYLTDEGRTSTFKCEKLVKTFGKKEEGDISVFTIENSSKARNVFGSRLLPVANTFPEIGDELVTAGFGSMSANTNRFDLTMSNDKDCILLRKPIKKLTLPDYSVTNSFSVGCDLSGGDSGSAIINKQTGEIFGILFGSADISNKNKSMSSEEMRNLLHEMGNTRIWLTSTYGINITGMENN